MRLAISKNHIHESLKSKSDQRNWTLRVPICCLYLFLPNKAPRIRSSITYLLLYNFDHFPENIPLCNLKMDVITTIFNHCLQELQRDNNRVNGFRKQFYRLSPGCTISALREQIRQQSLQLHLPKLTKKFFFFFFSKIPSKQGIELGGFCAAVFSSMLLTHLFLA